MSIFDKYGGWVFWEDAMDQLYSQLSVDSDLGHYFAKADTGHIRQMIASMLHHALGIPSGDFPVDIKQKHAKMHITAKEYNRFVALLNQLLQTKGVEDEDLAEIADMLQGQQGNIVT